MVSTSRGLMQVLYQRLTEEMMKTMIDISQILSKPARILTNSPVQVDNVPTVLSHKTGTYHLWLLSQSGRMWRHVVLWIGT
jgi:hypothetical protein